MALFSENSIGRTQFRNKVIDLLRSRLPQARIQASGDLDIAIAEYEAFQRTELNLANAYLEFEADPSGSNDIIARWTDAFVGALTENDACIDVSAIIPIIKSRRWLMEMQVYVAGVEGMHDFWTEDYNKDLVIAYIEMRQSAFSFVKLEEIAALSQPLDSIRRVALENLRVRSSERTVAPSNGLYLIAACGGLGASLLLDETMWSNEEISVRGDFLIGVPARDVLVVTGGDDPLDVFRAACLVKDLHHAEQYPISDRLYIRHRSRFIPLDTDAADETHPIPNLDNLDMHVEKSDGSNTLSIIIASPMEGDARSVYRVTQKLNAYLRYVGSSSFESKYGPPTPDNTEIAVNIHPMSDKRIVNLLQSLTAWVLDRGARLSVNQGPY